MRAPLIEERTQRARIKARTQGLLVYRDQRGACSRLGNKICRENARECRARQKTRLPFSLPPSNQAACRACARIAISRVTAASPIVRN